MDKYVIKIILIGDMNVGKTCFMYRLADHRFILNNSPTIGIDFRSVHRNATNSETRYKLMMWDTTGQERFRSIVHSYYRDAVGCLIFFDVTQRKSFNNVKTWYDDAKENSPDLRDSQILLVGTKSDLANDADKIVGITDTFRVVDTEEAVKFAEELGLLGYIETSAKDCKNLDKSLQMLVDEIDRLVQSKELKVARMDLDTFNIEDDKRQKSSLCCLCI